MNQLEAEQVNNLVELIAKKPELVIGEQARFESKKDDVKPLTRCINNNDAV